MYKQSKNFEVQIESFKVELYVFDFEYLNIVKILVVIFFEEFKEGVWIVMEYVGSRIFQSMINNEELCQEMRIWFVIQMLDVFYYIYDNYVLYFDLKFVNIFIMVCGDVKMVDFGCFQKVELDMGLVSFIQCFFLIGIFVYCVLEFLKGKVFLNKVDIYVFGVILWQMLVWENFYGNENQYVVIFSVVVYGYCFFYFEIDFDLFEECY